MSLPPGFLDELRSRTSITQVVGRKVMWDQRKSNQGKGDMWAPCPFHHEKTASFHVDDRKGYYYCFGCHAKGDALKFVTETENVSFMEAVEILAEEAGMQMPKRDPQAQQKADRRTQLAEVMEMATQHFRLMLNTGAGGAARAYLDGRGLSQEARDRFGIGFAPEGWQGLWDHLTGKGVAPDLILGAGLAKPSTKGGKPYDTFRNRIMFPIRDARGKCIAFGGRAMDPNDNAKYLNSPETELFDKGRSLYNHGPAREAAGKGQALIVAEGYMDVIALSEAGFGASVAPLGTAVTENQLQLLWRISDEPIIALDGDKAGLRAAMRVIDLALPLLEAGKSLRFAIMPEGQDPDDLIRAKGASAVQKVLDGAMPMVNLLWQREIEGKIFDSPERKAALDKTLREKIKLIQDPSIRSHYGDAIKELRFQLFRPQRGGGAGGGKRGGFQRGRWNAQPTVQARTKVSMLAASEGAVEQRVREAVVLAVALMTPEMLDDFEYEIESMDCLDQDNARMRDALMQFANTPDPRANIEGYLGPEAVENLLRQPHVAITPAVLRAGDTALARKTLREELNKLKAERGLRQEIAEAEEEAHSLTDETVTWRLGQAAEDSNKAKISSQDEEGGDYAVGANGAPIDREERAALDALAENIDFSRGGKPPRRG
ncbi:DNA primase [Shimia sp. R9_1]|uniref:DNA primase n=1 Tax=unclassified Shimia TaxID=2630038 RepID=UPI001ADB9792|nr:MULTISPECIES: DNA primase [unclassified Shimia]MBO9396204.1 DNA primase [Shimia sp. R9_2]MBO9406049.1 DNA primase [Shimia sp. R9_1]